MGLLIVLVFTTSITAGCTGTTTTTNTTTTITNATGGNDSEGSSTQNHHVTITSGMAFDPTTLTIAIGDSVTWTNEHSSSHTATSTDGTTFDSGTLGDGDSYTFTFETAGSYDYECEFHASMTGTIVVE